MVPCSNWLYLKNERYNQIDKRGAEINFHSTNKIDKININLEGQLTPQPSQSHINFHEVNEIQNLTAANENTR
jgi:hypothetical protein